MIYSASRNKEANQIAPVSSSQNYAKKDVLISKGESSYSPLSDIDDSSIVSINGNYEEDANLEEINKKEVVPNNLKMRNAIRAYTDNKIEYTHIEINSEA